MDNYLGVHEGRGGFSSFLPSAVDSAETEGIRAITNLDYFTVIFSLVSHGITHLGLPLPQYLLELWLKSTFEFLTVINFLHVS